ncbi:IS21 family transposase [Skermania sp. ID1734]|uniref:IS21 family transposase n=1 Tax=Skermania sp. ID1734 TaxID=2597516 RepID=UPI00117D5493|nr:IS21 family transposase [Skermania sp. ID1734]TSD93247.1 IS21 family transposase [Skermania sp. ID1734]
MGSRVELFERIRRDSRVEGLSVRALAKRHRVHRRTVRQALMSATPPPRGERRWKARKIDPFTDAIDAMLRADLTAPVKQRHTVRRIYARLLDEHGMAEVSYSTVLAYVAVRKPQIEAESGRVLVDAFVPQTHEPGAEAEVDFAEFYVDFPDGRTKVFLFTLRLSKSGRAVHRAFATQSQESFLEGHIAAFEELGGVPTRHIRYDNLKSAVTRVLFGDRDRVENQRWILFRSIYQFEAFYCLPGVGGAHEKGGVEGEGGRFRRNHLVPVPRVASLAALNELLAAADRADDARRIGNRFRTVGEDFAAERPLLRPLPVERFEPGLTLTPRVDRHARITVRSSRYSVPARLIGRRVRVLLRSDELLVFDGKTMVAQHVRSINKGAEVLDLDHYLEVLKLKPGALPGATALVQARAAGSFTAVHDAFWAATRKALGDKHGTRELIDVLLLHRHMRHADVVAGLRAAMEVGSVRADVVAVEARRHANQTGCDSSAPDDTAPSNTVDASRVVSLTERRLTDPSAVIAGLPADTRPLPSVDAYDELLHLTRKGNVS